MTATEAARLSGLAQQIATEAVLLKANLLNVAVYDSLRHREEALRRIGVLQEALGEVEKSVKVEPVV